ncbi:MAG TPA: TetR/AcrR family transcriptional regulator [Firmicutes bacterium]|nr:TetR/AcrR family transcriptional regulator [Bacillota bacterium]
MREKDDGAREKILAAAKAEFMEKGFADASMRTIAECAGFTTGMLYSRFADKAELFRELTQGAADALYNYFLRVQEDFARLPEQEQATGMHAYVTDKVRHMVDLIYDNFDAFKLVLFRSNGSDYEFFIDRMIDVETRHTFRYIEVLRSLGYTVPEIRKDFAHMMASAMLNGMFEVVMHDLSKEDATAYIGQLQVFFNAGWDKLFGF